VVCPTDISLSASGLFFLEFPSTTNCCSVRRGQIAAYFLSIFWPDVAFCLRFIFFIAVIE